ncbi:hypothetical protein DI272_15855 [Streptomyces sp. Act143]|nr:hypothetical protein DI272_15855 [Streptomyces sp. Act143]
MEWSSQVNVCAEYSARSASSGASAGAGHSTRSGRRGFHLGVEWGAGEATAGLLVLSVVEALAVIGLAAQVVLCTRPFGATAP